MPSKKQNEKQDALNRLPVYEIVIDPNDETTGVKMISLVDDPAIEIKGHAFKVPTKGIITPPCHYADSPINDVPNCECDIVYNDLIGDHEWVLGDSPCEFCLQNKAKWDALNSRFAKMEFTANKDKQIITGPFLIPNKKIFRRDPKSGLEYYVVFSPEVIQQIVEKFNKGNNNRALNIDHSNTMTPGFIMENWTVADSVYDKSKFFGDDMPVGSWYGSIKIEDSNFWKTQVKELGKFGFSVEGLLGEKLLKFALKKEETEDILPDNLVDLQLIELAKALLEITK